MEEFTRYGDEWKKEMNKWTKTRLIEMCAKIGKQNEKLEAMIEELISAKGIKELEARLADAEAHAQDFKDECERLSAALKEASKLK